jgi:hypothetical protein
VGDVFVRDRVIGQEHEVVFKASLRRPAEIENDLDDVFYIREADERLAEREGEYVEELRELPVRREGLGVNSQLPSSFVCCSQTPSRCCDGNQASVGCSGSPFAALTPGGGSALRIVPSPGLESRGSSRSVHRRHDRGTLLKTRSGCRARFPARALFDAVLLVHLINGRVDGPMSSTAKTSVAIKEFETLTNDTTYSAVVRNA